MNVGVHLNRAKLAQNYDTIVIGSGMGGLCTAACLAQSGQTVLVLERHYTPGGFTHTFERHDYIWDVGVHYVGSIQSPHSHIRKTFNYITGNRLHWQAMNDIYDSIEVDGKIYDLVAGRERFRERMFAYFPQEKAAIDQYLNLLIQVNQCASNYFLQKALPEWLGQKLYNTLSGPFLQYATRTTDEILSSLITDKTLIRVLTGQWVDYGLPPNESSFAMHALVAAHYLSGASYPVGGASAIARNIEPVIQKAGGQIVTCAEVEKIIIEDGVARGVRLVNGQEVRGSYIVSAVGVNNTYGKLLPPPLQIPTEIARYLAGNQQSISHLALYVGLHGTTHELALHTTNLWLHREPANTPIMRELSQLLGEDVKVVFISFPSSKDPEWLTRHPHHSTLELIVPVSFERFAEWQHSRWKKRPPQYKRLKSEATRLLLEVLYSTLPHLRGHLDYAEMSTPLSTRHFSNHAHGEMYGLRHDPQRFNQKWLRVDSQIKHLFLAGQDICTCGIGGALLSGVMAATRILGPIRGWILFKNTLLS